MYAKLGERKFQMIEHGNKKEGRKKAANIALLQLQREGKIPKPVRHLCISTKSNVQLEFILLSL